MIIFNNESCFKNGIEKLGFFSQVYIHNLKVAFHFNPALKEFENINIKIICGENVKHICLNSIESF